MPNQLGRAGGWRAANRTNSVWNNFFFLTSLCFWRLVIAGIGLVIQYCRGSGSISLSSSFRALMVSDCRCHVGIPDGRTGWVKERRLRRAGGKELHSLYSFLLPPSFWTPFLCRPFPTPHPEWAQAQAPPQSEPACRGVLQMTGTWHRCPKVRVFCCIIFPCGCPATLPPCFFRRMIESEHDRLMFFWKKSEISILKAYPKAFSPGHLYIEP